MQPFVAEPAGGRVFGTRRRVRSTEVTPAGRLRLDALARYLQEAAEDDLADAGWAEPVTWLVRKTALAVRRFPRLGEQVEVRTFCSGTGPRWAERTTTVSGARGGLVQAVAVWASVSRADGRPVAPGEQFTRLYGAAAGDRFVSARLEHPRPPDGLPAAAWPLRAADFDPARHVNNAIHWAVAEDVLAGLDWLPVAAEIEYHRPLLPGTTPVLLVATGSPGACLWLTSTDGQRFASARLTAPAALVP
jgi:acyl-ACP thioesterase